jgi:type I restriction enzyme M protein
VLTEQNQTKAIFFMVANHTDLEKKLWNAADQLRANSKLRGSEYSIPVLGLIFLKYAEHRFLHVQKELQAKASARRQITPDSYKANGAMYVPDEALYTKLVELPEGEDIAKAVSDAMKAIEDANPDLNSVLPKDYRRFDKATLIELLKIFNSIPFDMGGDVFGRIYEYFLSNFASSEGQRGGEFFTPQSIVKLIVEILEPYSGRIFDPACGSGGMFVQSQKFREEHHGEGKGLGISIFGRERVTETVRLCRMNLAVHGLSGDVKEANSYYDSYPRHDGTEQGFDFVMANPPFNVDTVDKERIKDDTRRFPFGLPTVDNGNYIWISMFYSALNRHGRAGFVMANSASDARGSEQVIRQKMVDEGTVDVMIAISSNFFYTVTLPVTLWFLDKGKKGTPRQDTVLFIDARDIFTQVDRAHREFLPEQVAFLAGIVRLYRGEALEADDAGAELLQQHFPNGAYHDVAGLCKVATRAEIAQQGYSLNPGRYVGVKARNDDGFDFVGTMTRIHDELEVLNAEAEVLVKRIQHNMRQILGG